MPEHPGARALASGARFPNLASMPDAFLERDFKAYERHRQDDPEYNALRLSVRRKLKKVADETRKRAKQELGVELSTQTGLHHPYSFNSFRVREQRAYLCRSNKERKKLASFFGEALGKDAETLPRFSHSGIDDQTARLAAELMHQFRCFVEKPVPPHPGR